MRDERLAVRPVTATPEQIPMLVPPFLEQHGRPETIEIAREMLRTTKEVRVLLGQFYLYIALARDRSLQRAVADAGASEGMAITEGALLRMLVIGIAAAFDQDPQTSNLLKLVRASLRPALVEDLAAFHRHYGVGNAAMQTKAKLIRIQRKLQSGAMSRAISNLTVVRSTYVAHFDAHPKPVLSENKALLRDVDRAVAAAGILVSDANVWILGRRIDVAGARALMREQAAQLADLLRRGAQARAP